MTAVSLMRRKGGKTVNGEGGLTRRQFLKTSTVATALSATGISSSLWLSGCRKHKPENKLNVLNISIDTLRADHVSCYG